MGEAGETARETVPRPWRMRGAMSSLAAWFEAFLAGAEFDRGPWLAVAFGCGIDRLAMLKYGMDDLRAFFDGDIRWLKHYGFASLDVPTLSGGVGA